MAGLYFLGIKKSTIKKTPPFKYLFDWRDKKKYKKIFRSYKNRIKNISSNEAIIQYTLNGKELQLSFRKFPCSDLNVFYQVFVEDCYRPIAKKMLDHFSSSEEIKIIDAGANVGYSTIYFKTFFPLTEIVAIEPEEKNAHQFEKNMELNKLQIKKMIRGALWAEAAFLEVARDFRDNRDAAITVRETRNQNGIPGFSFEQILQQNNWEDADLLKIDIEGSERFLFDTTEKADAILQKTKFLAIEIHDEFDIRKQIYAHLERNSFEYFEFNDLTLGINKNKI